MPSAIRVGLVGDFNALHKAHQAIPKALATASEGAAESVWVPTDSVGTGHQTLADLDGVWVVPGMPYRSADGALRAIGHARTSGTPLLGTSAGYQYVLIEYARNVLGLAGADHQKSNPQAAVPLIAPLVSALPGVKARVRFTNGSVLRRAYGASESVEEYHCSFALNPRYRRLLEGGALAVTAVDDQDQVRAVELDGHPFFVATLFEPELRSLPAGAPSSPIVNAFVAACVRHRQNVSNAAQ